MKIHSIFFGLLVLSIVSIKVGLSPASPILVILVTALALPILSYGWALLVAIYKTIKYFSNFKESLKKPASLLTIRESIPDLKRKHYKDDSPAHILNKRSEIYEKLFHDLREANPGSEFEYRSSFDFANGENIVHTIHAKTPIAVKILTFMKNKMMAETDMDLNFS